MAISEKELNYIKQVNDDPYSLIDIPEEDLTERICLEAVRQDGHALHLVKKQTQKICLAAIENNHRAFDWVDLKFFNSKFYLKAVERNGMVLEFLSYQDQTEELCLKAVQQNGLALEHSEHKTDNILMEAIKQNPFALEYVENPTERLGFEAVKRNGEAIEYINNPSQKIRLEAVKQDGWSIEYIEHRTEEECMTAIRTTPNITDYYLFDVTNTVKYELSREANLQSIKDSTQRYRKARYMIRVGQLSLCDSPYHALEEFYQNRPFN